MFEIRCEHCQSRYVLPQQVRDALRGQLLTCAVCMREWTGIPADPRSVSAGAPAAVGASRIPLHPYLQSNPYGELGLPTPAEGVAVRSSTQAVRVSPAGRPNLRVVASGPGLELDAVFELGERSLYIGGHDCHVELFHAQSLPDRAIRVRSVEKGFELEGVGGFLIPLGPVSIASGRLETGAKLDLVLDSYRVTLIATSAPGGPIRDLDAGAPRPAPAAPAPPKPTAPPPPPAAAAPVVDLSETVRGLGALGFDTRRFANPLDELDVGLVGLDPPVQGETYWFKKSPTLIGRTAGDIVIADSRVSGKHAQIDVLGVDQCAIKDLASTNGTTVNERPASTTRLKDGDVLGFGGVRLRFVVRPKKRGG